MRVSIKFLSFFCTFDLDSIGSIFFCFCLFCYTFPKPTNQKKKKKVCHLDIDLFGPDFHSHSNDSQQFSKDLFDRKYFHCRVISGFVSLRNFRFDIHSSQHLFNHSDLVFPNLEFIRDFLLVHQFQSDRSYSVNRTLGKFFPKLQGIFGHRRIENLTLYISHFDSSNRIDSVALNQICGPIKFFLSRPYFRHSPSYWRIIEHYHNRKIFSKNFPKLDWRHLLIIDDTNQNDQSRSRRESFDARLLFDDLIDEHSKLRASTLHVSIYEIDPRFYNYVENIEPKMEPKFCNQSSRSNLKSLINIDMISMKREH
ncbi:hypothetical protein QR98_0036280 [Sarcoptes scabiei]|uniref:Uncharacterized protein n=1 Tax=Sarcoptes scabiei TaxID=52283 RepID=A0A132A2W0_SARSC|nr:hypothetical protein QR98_0036280 [Sarcoptes scabiei]